MDIAEQFITDVLIADVLIARLNTLIEDPNVRQDVESLLGTYVGCSDATRNHPTIQAVQRDNAWWLGPLGLLNGLAGVIPEGPQKGWGRITAVFDDNGGLTRFERTKET